MADPYWVSPTGAETWANAQSATALSGTGCCSLDTANKNVGAGDTVIMRDGDYSRPSGSYWGFLEPQASGTAENKITFQAHTGETPNLTYGGSDPVVGIKLSGRSYIKIDGISVDEHKRWFLIILGSHYNELVNCIFDDVPEHSCGYIGAWTGGTSTGSTHNWVHNNSFTKAGQISACNDYGSCLRIGYGNVDPSNYNTIEDNNFSYGGHDLIDIGGKYNIVKNNTFHNEEVYFVDPGGCTNSPDSGYFGNRCIALQWYTGGDVCGNNLVENNRIGHAGTPPDDDGAFGISIGSPKNIIRFNYVYACGAAGVYFKSGFDGDYNLVYNNTLYYNGYGDSDIQDMFKDGVLIWDDREYNKVINNIAYDNNLTDVSDQGSNNTVSNNYTSDPSFVNPDVSDATSLVLPDLTLQAGSGALNGGTYLTQANGSGNGSITLVVDDAQYFQDGTWGSSLATLEADWIAIGTVGNVVQISSINYGTNTITLASAMTWNDEDPIWLYKDSDGTVVLNGSAPNYGADQGIPTATGAKMVVVLS